MKNNPNKPLKECKVLVTPTSFAKYDPSLARYLEEQVGIVKYNDTGKPMAEDDLIPIVGDFDAMIAGLDAITARVIEKTREMKVIARYGVGTNNVDLEAAKKKGIFVTNTPGANSVSVAELALGLVIAASRNIVSTNNKTKSGEWPRIKGIAIANKTIGIIGLGNIGKEFAARIAGFKVKILAYDIYQEQQFAHQYGIEYRDLDTLLANSDIVSLHIPVFPETKHIINKDTLAKMKKGAILINTSRGELIDEEALYESLVSGHLNAAAVDAFDKEPPGADNKLLTLDQVVATPHIGAATDDASNKMTKYSIDECLAVLNGKKPRYIVVEP